MSLITAINISDTFRTWLTRTNTIIGLLNSNTVVVGGEAIGAFTIGNTTHTGSSLILNGGKTVANMSGFFATGNATFGANVTINASAYGFVVSSNTTLLQSPNGTFINASTLTVNAPSLFMGPTSVSNTFAVTNVATFQQNVGVANNLIVSNTAYFRSLLFSESGAVVSQTISTAQYDDYTVAGLIDAAFLHLNPNTQDVILTGIVSPSNLTSGARVLYIQNMSATYKITLKSENGSSTVANRFKTASDADVDILPGTSLAVVYSTAAARWRTLSASAGASGNTGGAFATLSVSGISTFGANAVFDTNVLFVDAVNNRVGVGTVTPTYPFHVVGNSFFANTIVSGWANLLSTLAVTGNVAFAANFAVTGPVALSNTITITGAATLSNTLAVTGNTTVGNSTANVVMSPSSVVVANTSGSATKDWYGITPAGALVMFGGAAAPTGWLLANGQAVSRSTYATLFGVIGTTYGVGDATTTFNVPDLRQRFPLGKGASGTGSGLGNTGGSIDHTHTYTDVVQHTHPITDPGHHHATGDFGAVNAAAGGDVNALNGGGDTGNAVTGISLANPAGSVATGTTAANNPPFVTVNFIIKT